MLFGTSYADQEIPIDDLDYRTSLQILDCGEKFRIKWVKFKLRSVQLNSFHVTLVFSIIIKIYHLVVLGWMEMCWITITVWYCRSPEFSPLCTCLYATGHKSQMVWDICIIQIILRVNPHWACLQEISNLWA